ncbi:hypothetical protein CMI37_29250 [Candidatus Pacearchaeota archaeon]|nr:hypothetical protein [Candidatus Pacearchaeota archaeon]|tara:strand:- start:3700 stop:4017 length:318 start_codon:yes stop_codon:yes gene_type:complete
MKAEGKKLSELKDRIDDITTINFSITKCPLNVFKAFSTFCKKETNDNYAFGLKLLLDSREANVKEVVLYEQYLELKDEIENIKQKLDEPKKKKPITMGKGGMKDE